MSNWYVNSDELYHHGIIGQKWGVRRFQNADGSYTNSGKTRYGVKESKPQKKEYYHGLTKHEPDPNRKYVPVRKGGKGSDYVKNNPELAQKLDRYIKDANRQNHEIRIGEPSDYYFAKNGKQKMCSIQLLDQGGKALDIDFSEGTSYMYNVRQDLYETDDDV